MLPFNCIMLKLLTQLNLLEQQLYLDAEKLRV